MDFPCTQPLPDFDESFVSDCDDKKQVGVLIIEKNEKLGITVSEHPVYEGENIIGRHENCDISIPNGVAMSKKHACIEAESGSAYIFDYGSSNKTRLGKLRLKPEVRYCIQHEDSIAFANVKCTYKKVETSCISSPLQSEVSFSNAAIATPKAEHTPHLLALDTPETMIKSNLTNRLDISESSKVVPDSQPCNDSSNEGNAELHLNETSESCLDHSITNGKAVKPKQLRIVSDSDDTDIDEEMKETKEINNNKETNKEQDVYYESDTDIEDTVPVDTVDTEDKVDEDSDETDIDDDNKEADKMAYCNDSFAEAETQPCLLRDNYTTSVNESTLSMQETQAFISHSKHYVLPEEQQSNEADPESDNDNDCSLTTMQTQAIVSQSRKSPSSNTESPDKSMEVHSPLRKDEDQFCADASSSEDEEDSIKKKLEQLKNMNFTSSPDGKRDLIKDGFQDKDNSHLEVPAASSIENQTSTLVTTSTPVTENIEVQSVADSDPNKENASVPSNEDACCSKILSKSQQSSTECNSKINFFNGGLAKDKPESSNESEANEHSVFTCDTKEENSECDNICDVYEQDTQVIDDTGVHSDTPDKNTEMATTDIVENPNNTDDTESNTDNTAQGISNDSSETLHDNASRGLENEEEVTVVNPYAEETQVIEDNDLDSSKIEEELLQDETDGDFMATQAYTGIAFNSIPVLNQDFDNVETQCYIGSNSKDGASNLNDDEAVATNPSCYNVEANVGSGINKLSENVEDNDILETQVYAGTHAEKSETSGDNNCMVDDSKSTNFVQSILQYKFVLSDSDISGNESETEKVEVSPQNADIDDDYVHADTQPYTETEQNVSAFDANSCNAEANSIQNKVSTEIDLTASHKKQRARRSGNRNNDFVYPEELRNRNSKVKDQDTDTVGSNSVKVPTKRKSNIGRRKMVENKNQRKSLSKLNQKNSINPDQRDDLQHQDVAIGEKNEYFEQQDQVSVLKPSTSSCHSLTNLENKTTPKILKNEENNDPQNIESFTSATSLPLQAGKKRRGRPKKSTTKSKQNKKREPNEVTKVNQTAVTVHAESDNNSCTLQAEVKIEVKNSTVSKAEQRANDGEESAPRSFARTQQRKAIKKELETPCDDVFLSPMSSTGVASRRGRKSACKVSPIETKTGKTEKATRSRKRRNESSPNSGTQYNSVPHSPAKKVKEECMRSASLSLRPRRCKPKVMFTGVIDKIGEVMVKELGGHMTEDMHECTHLVTDKIRRTVKFLCAVVRGIHIVNQDWLRESKHQKRFLSEDNFELGEDSISQSTFAGSPESNDLETQFGFNLSESLREARLRNHGLFDGISIHVTKSVLPPPDQMYQIINCGGGTCVKKLPRGDKLKGLIIVSTEQDKRACSAALKANVPVVSKEFILTGILRQKLEIDAFSLFSVEISNFNTADSRDNNISPMSTRRSKVKSDMKQSVKVKRGRKKKS